MKILMRFALCCIAVCLALALVLAGNQLSRQGMASKLKHAGHEIVTAIEIYWRNHKELPPDLESLKLSSDIARRWNYSRQDNGYSISCAVAGFLDWKSSVLEYVRIPDHWIQGWVLTDENGEWE